MNDSFNPDITNGKSYVVMMRDDGEWDGEWWPCAVCDSREDANAIRDGIHVALNQRGLIAIEEVERNPVVPDLRDKGILWRVQDVEDGVDPDDYTVDEWGDHYIGDIGLDPGTTLHHLVPEIDVWNAYEMCVFAADANEARQKAFALLQEIATLLNGERP